MYRTAEGRQRRYTIGQHGAPWTPDTARTRALEILAEARVRGADPAATRKEVRQAPTVDELCDDYLKDAKAGRLLTRKGLGKKATTLATDQGRIDRHIRPLLGRSKVAAVTPRDVERFMHAVAEGKTARRIKTDKKRGMANVKGGKGTATRTVGLLGGIFTHAVKKGMRPDNPVHGVTRFADNRKDRRLTDEEYLALARGCTTVAKPGPPCKNGKPGRAGMWPHAISCTLFLALTGWRKGEALALRWRQIDFEKRTVELKDSKTGASQRALSHEAIKILAESKKNGSEELVFPPSRGNRLMSGFPGFFERILKAGKIPGDVTLHVLRHSFVSIGNDLGYTEATIGMLVGHSGNSMTRRYIHKSDPVVLAAADRIAGAISRRMKGSTASPRILEDTAQNRIGPGKGVMDEAIG
jgi:integrase